jgi:NAD(P)-dependent dehydrogenase (short-subunit alcohol dehydrogenase family)
MAKRFEGKVVIITGSSTGIGREAALDFAKEGASVTIHGQSTERLEAAKKALKDAGVDEKRVQVVQGSIQEEKTQKEIIDKTVEKFGKIDVLVNNAAIMKPQSSAMNAMDEIETYDYIFAVNVRSVILLSELAVPYLEKTKGNIVNISSIAAQKTSTMSIYYAMSKAALDHWSKNCAVKYAPKGIRVNTVSPGPIRTEFLTRHGVTGDAYDALEKKFAELTLLKRFGEPKEVTSLIKTLASDDSSYVTGAILVVDGGLLIAPPQ